VLAGRETPAIPLWGTSIDYAVTQIPRFAFEKFPQADPTLTTQRKSECEAMAIGRTIKEACKNACARWRLAAAQLRQERNPCSYPRPPHSPAPSGRHRWVIVFLTPDYVSPALTAA
jgi:carbamoylphosphate synthase large subunit